jgi:ribosomal protein S18 acetylase RimI-like enzyme
MAVVAMRWATSQDVERIAEVMHGEPSAEAVALIGTVDLARRFGRGLVRLDEIPNPAKPTIVAQDDGLIVGVLQYTRGEAAAVRLSLAQARLALGIFGPVGVLRRLPRLRARARVEIPVPPESFHIAEVHVDTLYRGRGIGAALLDWAGREAARVGATTMTLTTTTANPARRLYERTGYRVIRTATNPRYKKYTGIDGRMLMEKRIRP